jgi:hypothetical protein
MRAKEFITEQRLDQVHDGLDVASMALPNTYVIPKLKNSDFYDLYRFGVAIAGAKGRAQRKKDGVYDYGNDNIFGENEVVVSYDPNVEEPILIMSEGNPRNINLMNKPIIFISVFCQVNTIFTNLASLGCGFI